MKTAINKVALFCLGLALVGCEGPNNIYGTTSVSSQLPIHTDKGKNLILGTGTYKTQITMKKDKSAVVTVSAKSGKVNFLIPKNLANFYGKIDVSAQEMGQAFGLKGVISSSRQSFNDRYFRQCVWSYRSEWRCYGHSGRHYHPRDNCYWDEVPIYGNQEVYEEGYYEVKNIAINLVMRGTAPAKFRGDYRYGRKVTHSEVLSGCHR